MNSKASYAWQRTVLFLFGSLAALTILASTAAVHHGDGWQSYGALDARDASVIRAGE